MLARLDFKLEPIFASAQAASNFDERYEKMIKKIIILLN
jgi:hypothetical protein